MGVRRQQRGRPGTRGTRGGSAPRGALRDRARAVIRDAMLDAAERVFATAGYQGARMVDVAAAAGVATGTLYNYFENKQTLFQSLVERRLAEYNARIAAACAAVSAPDDELRALVRVSFEFLDAHRAIYRVFAELGGGSMMGVRVVGGAAAAALQEEYLRTYQRVVAHLLAAGRLRTDAPAGQITAFLIGTMTGAVQDWMMTGDAAPLSARAALVCDLFLSGAGAKP
ncbi:MAG: TetR/AcrR family transcriptional regulator [Deltaproteobacteria bacterium]|nr:MAG: TetR/AcrR family transcriptional regulator [Deltaproteobacteria bacterium]